jgi:hypothetical protein
MVNDEWNTRCGCSSAARGTKIVAPVSGPLSQEINSSAADAAVPLKVFCGESRPVVLPSDAPRTGQMKRTIPSQPPLDIMAEAVEISDKHAQQNFRAPSNPSKNHQRIINGFL